MRKLIILACSARKLSRACKAVDIYQGAIFKFGRQYAETNNYEIVILSALHGFLKPETVIEPYNVKMKKPYVGPWPVGEGFYVGGQLYFANAPQRFQPLVPPAKLGFMLSSLKQLTTGKKSRQQLFKEFNP